MGTHHVYLNDPLSLLTRSVLPTWLLHPLSMIRNAVSYLLLPCDAVRCLAQNAMPSGNTLTSLHVLALQGSLAVLESMARHCMTAPSKRESARSDADTEAGHDGSGAGDDGGEGGEEGDSGWMSTSRAVTAARLRERKQLKRKMALAAAKFNAEPKRWVDYAVDLGLVPQNPTPENIAAFLRSNTGLDKETLGTYISEPDSDERHLQTAIRTAYIATFDFEGMRIDEALRAFLESFRLPGEAQKIDRLMDDFAAHFFQVGERGPLASPSATFVLAFSIIMLNTDAHNPQVAKKMSLEEFIRNNRGINDDADLPREFLEETYHSIVQRGMVLTQEDQDCLDAALVFTFKPRVPAPDLTPIPRSG